MDPMEEYALSLSYMQVISIDPVRLYGSAPAKWNRIHRVLMRKWTREASKSGNTYEERVALSDAHTCLSYLRDKFSRLKANNPSYHEELIIHRLPDGKAFIYSQYLDSPSTRAFVGLRQVALNFKEGQDDLISLYRSNWERLQAYLQNHPDKAPHFPGITSVKVSPEEPPQHLLVEKPHYYQSLQPLVEKKGALDPRHVAWILTRLYYLSCLMQSAQVINLEVSPRTIFINPGSHELTLIGGWQYAERAGVKALAAPRTTLDICPSLADDGVPTYQHVHEMIRWTGLHLLGKRTLDNHFLSSVPEGLVLWLTRPFCKADPLEELQAWTAAKVKAFGPSQFTPWED